MPRLNYKLASQGLNTGGSGGGSLRPSLLNSSQAKSLRVAQVNPNAANIKYSKVRPPAIVPDNTISELGDLSFTITNSAFKIVERRNQLKADNLYLNIENELYKQQDGYVDENGETHIGYLNTEGVASSDGYPAYVESLDEIANRLLEKEDHGVRRFAQLRVNNLLNQFKHRASAHQSKQIKVEEQNTTIREAESLLKKAEGNPDSLFTIDQTTGVSELDYFVNRRSHSEKEKLQLKHNILSNVLGNMRTDTSLEPEARYAKVDDFYQKYKDTFPSDTKAIFKSQLQVMKAASDNIKAGRIAEALDKAQDNFVHGGSNDLFVALTGGPDAKVLYNQYQQVSKQLFKDDPLKRESVALTHIKEALGVAASIDGYKTAIDNYTKLQNEAAESGKPLLENVASRREIEIFMRDELPRQLGIETATKQAAYDEPVINAISAQYEDITKGIYSGQIPPMINEVEVLKFAENLRIQPDDSKTVRKEKRQMIKNTVAFSKLYYDKSVIPKIDKAMDTLEAIHADGKRFLSQTEFDAFLIDHGISRIQDRAALKARRAELIAPEGEAMNTYVASIKDEINRAYLKSAEENFAAHFGEANVMNFAVASKYIPVKAKNLRNSIDSISREQGIPPREKVEKIKQEIDSFVSKYEDADTLSEALTLEAYGVRTNEFITARSKYLDAIKVNGARVEAAGTGAVDSDILEPRPIQTDMQDMMYEDMLRSLSIKGYFSDEQYY